MIGSEYEVLNFSTNKHTLDSSYFSSIWLRILSVFMSVLKLRSDR